MTKTIFLIFEQTDTPTPVPTPAWPTPTPLPAPGTPIYEFDIDLDTTTQAEDFVQAWNTYVVPSGVWDLISILLIVFLIVFGLMSIRAHIRRL